MKVRITSARHILPIGTVVDVGGSAPRAWDGQYVVVIDDPEPEPKANDRLLKPKPG